MAEISNPKQRGNTHPKPHKHDTAVGVAEQLAKSCKFPKAGFRWSSTKV
jgi:hypothetical protein